MTLKNSVCAAWGTVLLGACGPAGGELPTGPSPAYARLLRALYRHSVPPVTAADLARELAQPAAPVLLDTRTPAEFAVSHLAGAVFVAPDSVPSAQFPGLARDRPVVVYCTVGARSERLGERLHALGFRHVRNLYGGLFEWVNEGYPVVDAHGLTTNVHPYSPLWRPWLRRGQPVYSRAE